ncbi:hypothetical protein CH063_06281 [Colletotrichum higginsianum]|uniref:Glucose-methanol-choline oxidoreductase C-terminal domain-containing protein n=1 Tax=Colletotrichum higginsianum (strain IMI 349063) TaxID=759273 RepID=H1V1Z7_COLHI|nr:hypothetical protein CH063_06281 [Colletotrichum higginsianum]
MNGTYDGEDSCFNQWQAGIGGLKGGSIRPTASRSASSWASAARRTCRPYARAWNTALRRLRTSPPLESAFERIWPPKQVSSEAKMKQFAEDEARGHHASCIAPIGADDNPQAVLDSNFKVHGVDGLRVVSASIFPKIPGFYVVLGIYMASKKATDVIFAEAQVA